MSDEASTLDVLAEQFAHPSVRVMARELTQLARSLERGTLVWPRAPLSVPNRASLPGLERIEAALKRPSDTLLAVTQEDWRRFARTVLALPGASPQADQQADLAGPHPAAVMALRLVWGAERFSELPTVILKPPPASFLEHLARLPAPERETAPEQLDHVVSAWLQAREPPADQERFPLPVADIRSFVRVVAACRVVGQMRQELSLEDVAAGYLAWARLQRANPGQLSNISSGWWTSTEGPSGRQPHH